MNTNDTNQPIPEGTYTVTQLLKSQGYATATIGKWGMGMFGTTGSPERLGVDCFFGYNCQRHAHSYFPTYLYDLAKDESESRDLAIDLHETTV